MLLDTIERLEGGRIRDPENGLIMPWYTSPCLEWLAQLDLKGKQVFEYGSGDSTVWFRDKGANTLAVEHNSLWSQKIKYIFHQHLFPHYCSIIEVCGEFDIVVIDGIYRDECTKYALKQLKSGGYLIIDNYKQKSADLEHWPLTEKLIEGLPITIYKEPNHEDWQTAVITKI